MYVISPIAIAVIKSYNKNPENISVGNLGTKPVLKYSTNTGIPNIKDKKNDNEIYCEDANILMKKVKFVVL